MKNALLVITVILWGHALGAAAPASARSISVHEINEQLQKLKEKYDLAQEMVRLSTENVELREMGHKLDRDLLIVSYPVEKQFKKIVELGNEIQKIERGLLSGADESKKSAAKKISALEKAIAKIEKAIFKDNYFANVEHTLIIDARLKKLKAEMLRDSLGQKIRDLVKVYKRQRSGAYKADSSVSKSYLTDTQ